MSSNISKKNLEHLFANDFSSPAFIMLADIYYSIKQYDRALKVCEIGLKNNPKNQIGKFILSKIMVKNKQNVQAEKLLKTIVTKDQNNIQALLLLLEVSERLNRKQDTIKKYYEQLLQTIPHNKKMQHFKKQNYKAIKSKHKKKREISIEEKKIPIDNHMATKTMYAIMKKQKQYIVAKQILEIMISKKNHVNFAKRELKTISTLIDKEKK